MFLVLALTLYDAYQNVSFEEFQNIFKMFLLKNFKMLAAVIFPRPLLQLIL